MAVEAGYQASIGTLTMDGLQKSKVPLVIGIKVQEYRHFVVYRGMDQEYVYVADPMRGNIRTLRPEFQKQWQQNAILAVVKPGAKIKETSPLSVTFGELVLGETNKDMIQKTYLRTMIPFPTSIRP
jgi:predicted double-glycine peptidase